MLFGMSTGSGPIPPPPPAAPDPASLRLRSAIDGDAGSLEWVVARFAPLVLAQVRSRLGGHVAGEQDLRDLADEVWLVALSRLRDLRPQEGRLVPVLARFLATTAVNACNNHLRSLARRRVLGAQPDRPADASAWESELAASESGVVTRASRGDVSAAIARALGYLSPVQRDVIVHRLLEDRSNPDIAALLDLSPNAVAVHYRRGLQQLRQHLDPSLFTDLRGLRRA